MKNSPDDKIVITGGFGFVGTNLAKAFRQHGFNNLVQLHKSDYDLTDKNAVREMYWKLKPDMVIHLAAEVGGIGANQENPGRFFYSNLMMGVNLIEEGRIYKIKKFVQVGTVCAYPKFTPVPFKETDLWNGFPEETNAPYGIAKKALLTMIDAYKKQYDLNGIYLLPVNLYGPGDNFDNKSSHVIPALIRKIVEAKDASAESVEIWGTGEASREFLYVEDCALGILKAALNYDSVEPVNLGSGMEIKIKDLASLIAGICGYEGKLLYNTSKPDGQPRRRLDVTKAKDLFNFEATTSFEDGLKETIDWFYKNRDSFKEIKY